MQTIKMQPIRQRLHVTSSNPKGIIENTRLRGNLGRNFTSDEM